MEATPTTRVIAEHPAVELVESRDDHTRVWEVLREVETAHPDGTKTVDAVKSYIHEKASGLCYQDASGDFVPSVAEWRETPDGFMIDRCGYGLSVGKTIGSGLRYTIDGDDLLLRPAYLMISDGVNEAHLAIPNPETRGCIVPGSPSVLRFAEAFGPGYDLEYVAEKGGFHQNLIIVERPVLPSGFDAAKTSVYLYTEMNLDEYLAASGLRVFVENEEIDASSASLLTSASRGGCISFCRRASEGSKMVHGFSTSTVMDSPPSGTLAKEALAEKRLVRSPLTRATYLVESVRLSYFHEDAESYPITWDYVQKSGSMNQDETWEPRYTYWVTADIAVSATLAILPGTTVKLNPSTRIKVLSAGTVIAKGEPYNYVTFTKASDSNCGEPIPGAPSGPWYTALQLEAGPTDDSVIQYCKFGHGYFAIYILRTLKQQNPIAHNILDDMLCGVCMQSCSGTVHNNVFAACSYYAVYTYGVVTAVVANNTIDHTTEVGGIWDMGSSSFTARDNLLSYCGTGIYTATPNPVIQHNRFFSVTTHVQGRQNDPAETLTNYPYFNSALGNFFLNPTNAEFDTKLKDKGSRTARDAGLGDEVFNVLAPVSVATGVRTQAETWDKIGTDTATVDIGYHHNRVDCYVGADTTFSGSQASLTVKPGVAVGILGGKSLMASNAGRLVSVGDPADGGLVRITNSKSLSMNIESPWFADIPGNPYIYISSDAGASSAIRFTRTSWLSYGVSLDRTLSAPIEHNVFSLSKYGVYAAAGPANRFLNNLFHENNLGAYASGNAEVRNSTFDRNVVGLQVSAGSGETLEIKDSLFSHHVGSGILINPGPGTVENDYNAFWQNSQDIIEGSYGAHCFSNKPGAPLPLTQSPYYAPVETGWELHYRLKQTSPVVNGGSCDSIDVGMDIFTTSADCRPDFGVQPARTLDIGYHFPIAPPYAIMHPGTGQTDLALYYHGMTDGCIRAFALDGDATDRMGRGDGIPTAGVFSPYFPTWRHNYHSGPYNPFQDGEGYHLKYDYHTCATFSGTSSAVNVGNAPDIQSEQTANGAIAAWIYPISMGDGSEPTLYHKAADGSGATKWLYLSDLSADGKQVRLCGEVGCAGTSATAKSEYFLVGDPKRLTFNRWHHVAITWERTGGSTTITLYINGHELLDDPLNQHYYEHQTGSGDPLEDSNTDGYIGASVDGDEGDHFHGRMADLFIHGRALLPDEIKWPALNPEVDPQHQGPDWLVTPNLGAMGEYERFPLGQMNMASYAVEDSGGNMWVSEFGVPRVTKLNQAGQIMDSIGGTRWSPGYPGSGDGLFCGPWGLALDSQDRLYVVDEGNYRMQVFDSNGNFIHKWGTQGKDPGQFEFPLCTAVYDESDTCKRVYVTDAGNYRIQKFLFYPTAGQPYTVNAAQWGRKLGWETFTGEGTNEMRSGGFYQPRGSRAYTVRISEVGGPGQPDEFEWTDDGGANWHAGGDVLGNWQWQPLSYGVQVAFRYSFRGGLGDRWDFTARHEQDRLDDEFVDLRGIDCDESGNVWVLDLGSQGDQNFLKKFNPDGTLAYKKFLDYTVQGPSLGHGLSYNGGHLYTGSGDLERDGLIFSKYDSLGNWVGHWGLRGSGPQESFCCWGVDVRADETPTMVTTDWFCSRLQEWSLDGRWIRTIQNHLRSDAQSFKCKNKGAETQSLYQTVHLDAGTYTLQFLAFTNGQQVTQDDVEPYAPGDPTGEYQNYWLTTIANDPNNPNDDEHLWACRVSATFTVGASGSYDIGAEVKAGKTVYIACLTCFRN